MPFRPLYAPELAILLLQVLSLDEKPFQAPEPSPFRGDNGGELAPVAHKYRSVPLGGEQTLIVRCEVRPSRQGSSSSRQLQGLRCAVRPDSIVNC